MRTRWLRIVAVACLASTALVGCGDDDDGGAAAPGEATTNGAADATPVSPTEDSGNGLAEPGTDAGTGDPAAEPPAGPVGPAGATTDPAPTGGETPAAGGPGTPAGAGPSSATPDPRSGSAGTSVSPTKPSKPEPAFVRSREVRILAGEGDDNPFEPRLTRVFQGTLIRWVNLDSVPRSVRATSGEFTSPMIPPGGFFDYQADELGLFEYLDGTRPTAMGAIQVV